MEFTKRRLYYNRCKPNEPLSPDDERNLDIDDFGTTRVRGVNWVEKLAGGIELSEEPVFKLFTGLPGSGKSTELRRLVERLSRPAGAHLLTVLIDAEQVIDLANPIDIPEIIAVILQGTEEAVLKAEGRDPDLALQEGYLTRLWNWLNATDVAFKTVEFAIPSGAKLVAEMKTRPSLRARVRETVATHLTTFLRQAREELELLNVRARDRGYRGLIVIFDSLEKLRGISTNWDLVLNSAERIFGSGAPYLRLPVHVLYTIPPALALRLGEPVPFMPMIKLHDQDNRPFQPGLDAAREIVRRRVPDAVMADLLGPGSERRVGELIRWSGGYPRELLRLLQSAFAVPSSPLSDGDFDRILNELRDAYRRIVPANTFEWLAGVAAKQYLTIQNDDHRQAADHMLANNAILKYLNEHEWYELHPAVDQIPGVAEARAALDRARDATPAGG